MRSGASSTGAGRGRFAIRTLLGIRRRSLLVTVLAGLAATVAVGSAALSTPRSTRAEVLAPPFRAFSSDSYWNRPLDPTALADPASDRYVGYLRQVSTHDFLVLAGLGQQEGQWSQPVYWADGASRAYAVRNTCGSSQPPAFSQLRIPAGAEPSNDSDHELTVYDLSAGFVAALWQASYDAASETWSACGGDWYSLASNGLHGSLAEADDPRNQGHRGVPPPVHAVRWDEVSSGSIDHVLKFSARMPARTYVFPMIGSDGRSDDPAAPPQGMRLRIKPSVDLRAYELSTGALVVARALQVYGAVLGDSSGGPVSMRVQSCQSVGRAGCWSTLLSAYALESLPLEAYEFVRP